MSVLSLSFLGAFDGTLDDESLSAFRSNKARALLAYLTVECHQAHPRSTLSALLWPDSNEAQASNSMRVTLRQVRIAIQDQEANPAFLLINRQTVQANPDANIEIDVHRFEHLLTAGDPDSRRQAIELYQGDFLAGILLSDCPEFESWMLLKRAYYTRLALTAFAEETDFYLSEGKFGDAERLARRQLELDEWRESAHRQLMNALVQRGDRNAALAQYTHCQQLLWEDLGVPPDSATTELYEVIKRAADAQESQLAPLPVQSIPDEQQAVTQRLAFEDWGEMPVAESVHGREAEVEQLIDWIETEQARLVAILGIGGQGKTTLAAAYVQSLLEQPEQQPFSQVIWRSLLNAPPLFDILQAWLGILVDESEVSIPDSLDEAMGLLFQILRKRRILLILDNVESILAAGETVDSFRPEFAAYDQLFMRMGESDHQSCLLMTSRESPAGLVRLDRRSKAVHILSLDGLSVAATANLLEDLALNFESSGWQDLVARYSGNPLALLIIADTIDGIFDGDIQQFLADENLFFDDIRHVLDEQFARLTELERSILIWLAIEREGVSVGELRQNLLQVGSQRSFLDALRSLQRRSLLIRSRDKNSDAESSAPANAQPGDLLTMQNVIIEYTTDVLIETLCAEFRHKGYNLFLSHSLLKANGKEYVRNSQQRLILEPLAHQLLADLGRNGFEQDATEFLDHLHQNAYARTSYGPGNLLNLMLQCGLDLQNLDFSDLVIRQAFLRNKTVTHANFTNAEFVASVFTDTFSNVRHTAFSPDGQFIAGATSTGEIRLWHSATQQPANILSGHNRLALSVAWNDDGSKLASGGEDGSVRIWEKKAVRSTATIASGLWQSRMLYSSSEIVRTVAFLPAKSTASRHAKAASQLHEIVAAAGNDPRIGLWSTTTGKCVTTLHGHTHVVTMLAFNPNGNLLASCSADGSIRIWSLNNLSSQPSDAKPLPNSITSPSDEQVAEFTPEVHGRILLQLPETTLEPWAVAFGPDGSRMAAGSLDGTIWIWRVDELKAEWDTENPPAPATILKEHQQSVQQLVFSPDGAILASGGDDRLIRLWDVATGRVMNTLQGHTDVVLSIDFHPNGNMLASGSLDGTLRIWNSKTGSCEQTLTAASQPFNGVAFGPTSDLLVTASGDHNVRVWDAPLAEDAPAEELQRCRHVMSAHVGMIWAVAHSPHGPLAASVGEDMTVALWDTERGLLQGQLYGHEHIVTCVDFSHDGKVVASGGIDQTCRLWDVATGDCIHVLNDGSAINDVHNAIWSVCFSPDGALVAAGFGRGAILLWEVATGKILQRLSSHVDWVRGLAFSPDGKFLISGGNDHSVRIWSLTQMRVIQQLNEHTDWVMDIAMHPGGQQFASAGHDQTIRLWQLGEDGRASLLDVLTEHHGNIWAIDFSRDGSLIASASVDETVKLWDVASRICLKTIRSTGPYEGTNITGVKGVTEAQRTALLRLGAIEQS